MFAGRVEKLRRNPTGFGCCGCGDPTLGIRELISQAPVSVQLRDDAVREDSSMIQTQLDLCVPASVMGSGAALASDAASTLALSVAWA
jgi:hypothetical protein